MFSPKEHVASSFAMRLAACTGSAASWWGSGSEKLCLEDEPIFRWTCDFCAVGSQNLLLASCFLVDSKTRILVMYWPNWHPTSINILIPGTPNNQFLMVVPLGWFQIITHQNGCLGYQIYNKTHIRSVKLTFIPPDYATEKEKTIFSFWKLGVFAVSLRWKGWHKGMTFG